jgi:thymidine kinase
MCYGLRVDFQGNLFPGSAALLAWADEMREVRTICHCGKKATMVFSPEYKDIIAATPHVKHRTSIIVKVLLVLLLLALLLILSSLFIGRAA